MQPNEKPAGLVLRGQTWHISKVIRFGEERFHLRESTGTSNLKAATVILNRREAQIRERLMSGFYSRPSEHTFNEAAAEYIADVQMRNKHYQRALIDIRMLEEVIGNKPLSQIHQAAFKDWIQEQRGKRASASIKKAFQTVSSVLNFAARVLRNDDGSPWLSCQPPKLIAPDWGLVHKPYPLSWDEQARLLSSLPEHMRPIVAFASATGARQQEFVKLRWDQHLPYPGAPEFSFWQIPPEVRKGSAHESASERQGRILVCNADARAVIAAQYRVCEWVFPSTVRRNGARTLPYERLNTRCWREGVKRAGLAIRVHDLRHTFGRRLADAGVPLDSRRALLGHRASGITEHYSLPGLLKLLSEAEKACCTAMTQPVDDTIAST